MGEQRWVVRSGADLGRAVAEIRRLQGMTQAELAEQVGLGRTWLAKLESGRTSTVLELLLRLLRRLGAVVTISVNEPAVDHGSR